MTELQPIAVLGGGSFGTALANLLAENGQRVLQWMRDPEQAEQMRRSGENPRYLKGVKLHPGIEPTSDLAGALRTAGIKDVVVLELKQRLRSPRPAETKSEPLT